MRISDWSSDVCSSDLREKRTMNMLDVDAIRAQVRALDFTRGTPADAAMRREDDADARANLAIEGMALDAGEHALFDMPIGSATCRERVCRYVSISGVAVTFQNKQKNVSVLQCYIKQP